MTVLTACGGARCSRNTGSPKTSHTQGGGNGGEVRAPKDLATARVPPGIYALTPAMQPIPERLMALEDVTGIVIRGEWADVEAKPGEFDFGYFDRELERIGKAGKKASLVITSGGRATPTWLGAEGLRTVSLTDPNPYHRNTGSHLEIPVFWDPKLLARKELLIKEMGRRFAARPELVLVSAQCANATTDDWNLPARDEQIEIWRRAGFTEDRLLDACKRILDATMIAFPNQAVRMALGRVPTPLASDPDAVARGVLRYANARYPGRFFAQRHNLSTNTPEAGSRELHGWQVLREASPNIAAQFLWPAKDVETCRLAGGTRPCEARSAFSLTVDRALSYGFRYVEVYSADLLTPELSEEVHRLAIGLEGKSPEAAPTPVARASARGRDPGNGGRRGGHAAQQGDLSGTVKEQSFVGKVTGKTVEFSVYLPPGDATGTQRLPVVYWLHGKNGDHRRSTHVARYLELAVAQGTMPRTMMVFPNGGAESFYTDAPDGSWPIETMIIKDLIPHIDASFPTLARREGRALMGFSMGGFGALKLAAKHSDLFTAVVAYGAPRLDASMGMGGRDRSAFARAFEGDQRRFEENTPGYLFVKHRTAVVDSRLRIRIVAGERDGTRHSVMRMHEILADRGIQHEYEMLPGVAHVVGGYYDAEQGRGFAFLGRVLSGK